MPRHYGFSNSAWFLWWSCCHAIFRIVSKYTMTLFKYLYDRLGEKTFLSKFDTVDEEVEIVTQVTINPRNYSKNICSYWSKPLSKRESPPNRIFYQSNIIDPYEFPPRLNGVEYFKFFQNHIKDDIPLNLHHNS